LLSSLGELDNQKSQNDLKENLLNLVESNIKSYNNGEEIVPNSNGLQDAVLFEMINKYNQLVLKKRLILDGGTSEDLRLESINGQLEEIRNSILKNVGNIRKEISANKTSLSNQERNYSSRFEVLPGKEKKYIQLNRTLGIKESLYVFLLQKREESSIHLVSSDMPRTRIIDEEISGGLVSPNRMKTYLLAFALGLSLPAFIVLLRLIFSTRVESREEIASGTHLRIAGEIGQAPKKSGLLVASTANQSKLAEQFRSLRTNLFYLSKGLSVKVIMVTSFKQGEGKSFITSNLADSIAVTGKKVVMLDFDLRKACLSEKLGLNQALGVSDLLSTKIPVAEVVIPLDEKNRLFFIPAGNIPDNPGELVLSDRMKTLFEYLKENYDYILIDTAPIGVVSDAINIGSWADMTLFIIRHNYSLRSSVTLINNLNEENKLPNLTLVINGIQSNNYQFGGYGYGYEFDKYKNPNQKRFKVV
jgi:capsular exopolysaccharide synthesis family protein